MLEGQLASFCLTQDAIIIHPHLFLTGIEFEVLVGRQRMTAFNCHALEASHAMMVFAVDKSRKEPWQPIHANPLHPIHECGGYTVHCRHKTQGRADRANPAAATVSRNLAFPETMVFLAGREGRCHLAHKVGVTTGFHSEPARMG